MASKLFQIVALFLIATCATAADWVEVKGRTVEEAKQLAKDEYAEKLVGEGSCRWDKNDGWVYCRFLINN